MRSDKVNYRILVFISKNRLSAVNIDKSGIAENISLEGNTEIEYSDILDIDAFCQYIKDYFNIDNFCDIDLSIFILNFSAAQSMVNYLFDSFNTVNSLNVIDANLALPIFALKYFNIQPDTCYNISAFGINHQIFVDNKCICKCKEVNDVDIERELALYDYINLFEFCCSEMIEDESNGNELIEDYQKEISKLTAENQELLAKIELLETSKENEINTLKKTISELTLQLEKFEQNSVSDGGSLAEQLRNTQEKDWLEFEKIIIDLIKSDIKSRAEKGYHKFSVDLEIYCTKLEENYCERGFDSFNQEEIKTLFYDFQEDLQEYKIWHTFREQFLKFGNSFSSRGNTIFGANPKILDKLSNALVSKFASEGFEISVEKKCSEYNALYKTLWLIESDEDLPSTLIITISW